MSPTVIPDGLHGAQMKAERLQVTDQIRWSRPDKIGRQGQIRPQLYQGQGPERVVACLAEGRVDRIPLHAFEVFQYPKPSGPHVD